MTIRKVAIITGASQSIGPSLVAGYRRRDWLVVASDRSIKPSPDPGVLTVTADATEPTAPDQIVGAALERFGRIDTLVNNAGMVISKPFADYSAADYATAMEGALAGFFWLTQRAIGEMAVRYGGHVVNVGAAGPEATDSGAPAVLTTLTRGALAAATRSLAIEYASLGIRVNAVFPGVIQTPMRLADGDGRRVPLLGRAGQVSDVTDGILFLESSPYITGEILHIDGGGQVAGHREPGG